MGKGKKPLYSKAKNFHSRKKKYQDSAKKTLGSSSQYTRPDKRDPTRMLIQIERLRMAEAEGKLDGPGRMRRKRLEDQFRAMQKALEKAKKPTLALSEFDPEEYLQRNKNETSTLVSSGPAGKNDIPIDVPWPGDEELEEAPAGLPPYRLLMVQNAVVNTNDDEMAPKLDSIITAEPVLIMTSTKPVTKKNRKNDGSSELDKKVDEFLSNL